MTESLTRIWAMFLRHWYILRGSPTRVIEIVYWPTLQMVLWGFISNFFAFQQASTLNVALGTLLGGVLLWDMLFRSQLGISISYLEEVWSRNLGHLFISPLRAWEWWGSMILFSVIRTLVGMLPAALLAIPFYGFSIFSLGLPLLAFFFNVMFMGWWLGFIVTALIIRAGQGAESLAWALTFFLAPVCAVYYPVSILPKWMQPISHAMPASHVFEGLRALVREGVFDVGHMVAAFALNLLYLALSLVLLQAAFNNARQRGALLQTGE